MLGVGLTTLLIGVTTAWIITRYKFFLSSIIEWALLLPAAIPAYLVAYCYTDFLEYGGILQTEIREIFNWTSSKDYFFPEIRSMGGAILMLSFVLYPYVYFITKIAFRSTPKNLFETARILGKSEFYSVAIPMARPAIIAGLSLVLMETISDFGTVEFFAIETFTLGIFNVWLGMNNLGAAAQLSLISFIFIVVVLGIELTARKNRRFNDTKINNFKLEKISNKKEFLLLLITLTPIIFGFMIPVLILINLAVSNFHNNDINELIKISYNTIFIASVASLLIILISLILSITVKYKGKSKFVFFATTAGIGYAFPGIILALGTTFFLAFVENLFESTFRFFDINLNIVLIGSYSALIFAYISRFNAIGFGSLTSGILRMPPNLVEASRVLGYKFEKSVFKVVIPIIRPSILTGLLLVFVDITKELPMTLLLRPFNFETLATFVYQYAKEEMLEQCALAALFIVLVGIIPIILLNKIINKSSKI
tara:strand:- start:27 stop:1475 length:1449 start_codon:yes stop_codon:yes gene_type:complete